MTSAGPANLLRQIGGAGLLNKATISELPLNSKNVNYNTGM